MCKQMRSTLVWNERINRTESKRERERKGDVIRRRSLLAKYSDTNKHNKYNRFLIDPDLFPPKFQTRFHRAEF